MSRLTSSQEANKNTAYDIISKRTETNLKIKNAEERVKLLDEKYTTIVSVILNEIHKRNIYKDDPEFNEKIDQIIETLQHNSFFKVIKDDNPRDIRNVVKRRLNIHKNKEGEGPEL